MKRLIYHYLYTCTGRKPHLTDARRLVLLLFFVLSTVLLLLQLPTPLYASDFQIAYGQGEYENTTDHRPLELDLSLDLFPINKSTRAQFTAHYLNGDSAFDRLDRTESLFGLALAQEHWQAGVQLNDYSIRLHAQGELPLTDHWSLTGGVAHQRRFKTDEDHPKLKMTQVHFGVAYEFSPDWQLGLRYRTGNLGRGSVADDMQLTLKRSW